MSQIKCGLSTYRPIGDLPHAERDTPRQRCSAPPVPVPGAATGTAPRTGMASRGPGTAQRPTEQRPEHSGKREVLAHFCLADTVL